MLTAMTDAATLLRSARESSGLSARALAQRAGVAFSTVTRIEAGSVDPTFEMLQRLIDAAGQHLVVTTEPSPDNGVPRLSELRDAWHETTFGDEPDWTRFRSFLDRLAMRPDEAAPAIRNQPGPSGSPLIDTLLAGIAEKVAHDVGITPPLWTRRTAALDESWTAPGTPRMQARWRESTPPELLERGLLSVEESLWRDRTTVGV